MSTLGILSIRSVCALRPRDPADAPFLFANPRTPLSSEGTERPFESVLGFAYGYRDIIIADNAIINSMTADSGQWLLDLLASALRSDGFLIVFNDPLPCADPSNKAVRMAIEMRGSFATSPKNGGAKDTILGSAWGSLMDSPRLVGLDSKAVLNIPPSVMW
jgi:hypothetical protein